MIFYGGSTAFLVEKIKHRLQLNCSKILAFNKERRMRTIDIIIKKREKEELSKEEIIFFVESASFIER